MGRVCLHKHEDQKLYPILSLGKQKQEMSWVLGLGENPLKWCISKLIPNDLSFYPWTGASFNPYYSSCSRWQLTQTQIWLRSYWELIDGQSRASVLLWSLVITMLQQKATHLRVHECTNLTWYLLLFLFCLKKKKRKKTQCEVDTKRGG